MVLFPLRRYPFQVFSYIVAFSLVFRTNAAYGRYWEMRHMFARMQSKWADAAALALAFEELSMKDKTCDGIQVQPRVQAQADAASATPSPDVLPVPAPLPPPKPSRQDSDLQTRQSQALVVHRFSLMHALAVQYLRRDNDLGRLTAIASFVDEDEAGNSSASTEEISKGLTPFASWSWASWRSQWAELFADQDDLDRHEQFTDAHPLPVLGGLDEREKVMLETHPDRVYFLYSLILGQFNARRVVGGLGAEAPVYTRVQHVMSDGMLGFMQARKIEDTPFPFPYAQLLACMLYAFGLLFPLLAASKVGTDPIVQDEDDLEGYGVFVRAVHSSAPGLTFLTVLAYFGMHEVARELG